MNPPNVHRFGGVVLAGGRSSRMGRPKAWLPVGGETMLSRTVRVVGQVCEPVIVVAAMGQDLPALPPHVRVVRDAADGCGPLMGLAVGLAAMPLGVEAVYLSSCDVPLLHAGFVAHMLRRLGDHSIAVPRHGGQLHPLAAVYARSVLALAEGMLRDGRFRMTELFDEAPTLVVEDVPHVESLRNVNTLAEYEALLAGRESC